MTAPRHGLGAHQHNSFARDLLDEASQIFSELQKFACNRRNRGMKRFASPYSATPGCVQRQESRAGNMRIANAGDLQMRSVVCRG